LQATIRRLLPSQQGFGVELAATNVITPIIDLTPTAEGSSVPEFMQQALAFDSQTAFDAQNETLTLMNNPGFWRLTGIAAVSAITAQNPTVSINMSDGLSTKTLFTVLDYTNGDSNFGFQIDEIIFLRTDDSVSVTSSAYSYFIGSYRQVADVNGNLVNPVGFSPQ
jgi:hypothetical protein